MEKPAKKAKTAKRARRERRFLPRATANPAVVAVIGGLGALAMGAGAWGQWGRTMFADAAQGLPYASWMLAGAAVLLGIAIWIGTSGEPAVRVGDGGVAIEKGGNVLRMPWHQVESVDYEGAREAVVAKGRDETGGELAVVARLASLPQAAAWIVREARDRVPDVLHVGEEIALPEARTEAGEGVTLDPLQVVGKRCAVSGTIIAFEPDARVCPRCERIFHKDHVPEECACGAPVASLQAVPTKRSAGAANELRE